MNVKCNAVGKWGLLQLKHRNFVVWAFHLATISGIMTFKFCGSHPTWGIRREVLIAIASDPHGNGSGRLFLLRLLQGKGLCISFLSGIIAALLPVSRQATVPCLVRFQCTFSLLLCFSGQRCPFQFSQICPFCFGLTKCGCGVLVWILLHFLSKLGQS